MAVVGEGALAHAGPVVAEGEVIVGLPPAESLGAGDDGLLHLLVVVSELAVLAPPRLVLALGAVVRTVLRFVVHLEHGVERTRLVSVTIQGLLLGSGNLWVFEVGHVVVRLVELSLELSDLSHHRGFRLTSLFLNKRTYETHKALLAFSITATHSQLPPSLP